LKFARNLRRGGGTSPFELQRQKGGGEEREKELKMRFWGREKHVCHCKLCSKTLRAEGKGNRKTPNSNQDRRGKKKGKGTNKPPHTDTKKGGDIDSHVYAREKRCGEET